MATLQVRSETRQSLGGDPKLKQILLRQARGSPFNETRRNRSKIHNY